MTILTYQCRNCPKQFELKTERSFEEWDNWLAKTLNSTIRFHECETGTDEKRYGLGDLIAIEEREEKP